MLATVPATSQAIAARLLSTDEQALLSVSISVGAFLAALLTAITLEARLSQPNLVERSFLPFWSVLLGIIGSVGCVMALFNATILLIYALPLIMVSLQVGRTHAITESRYSNEGLGGLILFAGALSSYVLALFNNELSISALGVSTLGVVVVRAWRTPLHSRHKVRMRNATWVGLETAIVASTPLLVNITILLHLGAKQAIAFRLILTTLGVLQPILGMLRTRLLSSASRALSIALSTLTAVTLIGVILLDILGLFSAAFGESWNYVPFAALCLGCLWKFLSIPQTFPFTRMRRRGEVRLVFAIRAVTTALFLATGAISTLAGGITLVFACFCIAEILTAALYCIADAVSAKRATSDPDLGSSLTSRAR